MTKLLIDLRVNGQSHELAVSPHDTLLEVLRDQLDLVGTKEGCGVGECGACTVLMAGRPVLACLVLAPEAAGHDLLTIEGLARGESLDPVQESFVEHGAVQCGFCSPGLILTAKELLTVEPRPDETRIREAIAGHVCRCTGYTKIVEAIQDAAPRDAAGPGEE